MGEKTKKDACYHKVKARYDVGPSAYASGALSKCRKVGAANWGNSKKKKLFCLCVIYIWPADCLSRRVAGCFGR